MDIVVTGLTKSYGDKTVLQGVSYTFKQGGSYCIMAPSGYGKTTLLHILMGLQQPDSGTVSGLAASRMAPVFQENRLCNNLSVGANLRLTLHTPLEDAQLEACLAALGLPNSLHTPVHQLSGGMQRRVAIARALCSGGDVLLMDEPFKGLDKELKEKVMAYVKQAVQHKTMIWVTHDEAESASMGAQVVPLEVLNRL